MRTRRRLRPRSILLATLVAIGLLGAAGVTWEHYRGRAAWKAYYDGLRQRSLGPTFADLPPPPLPDGWERLATATIRGLLDFSPLLDEDNAPLLLPLSEEHSGPGLAIPAWSQREALLEDTLGRRPWPDSRRLMAGSVAELAEFRERLLRRPFVPAHPNRRRGVDEVPVFHYIQAAKLLNAWAMTELAHGHSADGLEALIVSNRLGESLTMQPEMSWVGFIGCLSMASINLRSAWAGLQYPDWSDAQLRALQEEWMRTDVMSLLPLAVLGERAFGLRELGNESAILAYTFDHWPGGRFAFPPDDSSGVLTRWADAAGGALLATFSRPLQEIYRFGWMDQSRLFYSEVMQTNHLVASTLVESRNWRASGPAIEILAVQDRVLSGAPRQTALARSFRGLACGPLICYMHAAVQDAVAGATRRELALAALALRRFRIAEGRHPETLTELVPRFLPATPHDWMDGQPLKYRRLPDGAFLLYSSGWDGVDHGGDATPVDAPDVFYPEGGRDWVWPRWENDRGQAGKRPGSEGVDDSAKRL